MNKQPIGLFDSGVGGTSIWKEIHRLLPNEHSIYLADSINAPYGPKGKDKIIELSIKNTELLLEKNCKLIVVACNTATTNAIQVLRKKFNVPFIGIEPAIKPAALNTTTKAIGILATKGTLSSALFHHTTSLYTSGITIVEQIGEGIVQRIENGNLESVEMEFALKSYLKPMLDANIDYLVLGCTHYSYLIPKLITLLPNHVKIIDSGLAVAKQTQSILEQHKILNTDLLKPKNEFYINLKTTEVMKTLLGQKFNVDYLEF